MVSLKKGDVLLLVASHTSWKRTPGSKLGTTNSQTCLLEMPLESEADGPLGQCSPTFLAPGTSFVEDGFSLGVGRGWGDGSGGNASDGGRRGAGDEALLARPPLTFCCAARFPTGLGPLPVCGPGVEEPCSRVHWTWGLPFQTTCKASVCVCPLWMGHLPPPFQPAAS